MTLQQMDDVLAQWNNRLATIAENVLELQADPTYQLLTGAGGRSAPQLEGLTAARAGAALGAMLLFHEQFGMLRTALERVSQVRATVPRIFGAEGRLAELERMLTGQWIELPADGRPALGNGRAAQRVSLVELENRMLGVLGQARDVVQGVSRAWSDLAVRMDDAEARMAELARMAREGGAGQAESAETLDWQVMLGGAAHLLKGIRADVPADPLGAAAEFEQQMQPLLARVGARAARAEERERKMREARRLSAELADLQAKTRAAVAETRRKVAHCDRLPGTLADETLAGLREWLSRLEGARPADGGSDAVDRGLRNWTAAAQECAEAARKALEACRAPLDERNELRGRLEALKSKARVYGVAELPAMAELARGAEAMLYAQPTDLERVGALVSAYEKTLQISRKEAQPR